EDQDRFFQRGLPGAYQALCRLDVRKPYPPPFWTRGKIYVPRPGGRPPHGEESPVRTPKIDPTFQSDRGYNQVYGPYRGGTGTAQPFRGKGTLPGNPKSGQCRAVGADRQGP